MTIWDDLNARARGLTAHLLGRATLEHLARSPDLPALAGELRALGYPLPETGRPDASVLELSVRRRTGERLAILRRWAGARAPSLAILLEDEDRRSIVSLLRGAVQHAPPDQRLAGLIPTPELPERALEELSRQPAPAGVVALLVAWDHPLGPALVPLAGQPEPDLLHLEVLLHRAFAARALRFARRAGRGGMLARHVRRLIDLENAFTVVVLSEEKDSRVAEYWLSGGEAVTEELAQRAVATESPFAAARVLARAFEGSPLADAFADRDQVESGIETAALRALIEELRAAARQDPLSPAVLLSYGLRLRAERLDLGRIIWGLTLGAPAGVLTSGLATVA